TCQTIAKTLKTPNRLGSTPCASLASPCLLCLPAQTVIPLCALMTSNFNQPSIPAWVRWVRRAASESCLGARAASHHLIASGRCMPSSLAVAPLQVPRQSYQRNAVVSSPIGRRFPASAGDVEARRREGRVLMDADAMASRVARRIKFRLDDGSVIGDSNLLGVEGNGVVRLRVDTHKHLASEKDLERIQRLLSLPELPPLPQLNGDFGPPSKKARMDSRPSLSLAGTDWVPKCREMLQNVVKGLKADIVWFLDRVKEEHAPDYFTIVKHPMWIKLVQQKLEHGEYATAQDFCEDVRLIWANCQLYNPVGNSVRIISEKAEKRFENEWANSGLSSERTKRATAGVAAPKYDPDFEPPAPKTGAPPRDRAPTKSGNANNNAAPKKPPTAAAAAPPRANGRANSHEVTSGGKGREKALSLERRNQIATELQNALGELSEEQLNELMSLLPSEAMQPDESGEMELDFEALDDSNLRKLESWLRNVRGQAPVSPSHVSINPSVRLEAGDVDDEDYHSD
ncbi:hypothetical protein TSOC_002817, partial [Tetrabaena socialis]